MTGKRRILEQIKYGKYYKCRLNVCKESVKKLKYAAANKKHMQDYENIFIIS